MPDNDEVRRFLARPDVQAFAATEEGRRLLRPGLMRFLSGIGVQPQVDAATGEMVVAICTALGLDSAEEAERAQGLVSLPSDRLKLMQ